MKYLKAMLLAAVAMCAFGAASAQAALPEFTGTFPTTFTASSTNPKFEASGGNLIVECKKSEGTGEVSGAKAAKFDELFLECKATIFKLNAGECTGLNDTVKGSILAKGSTTLGFRLGTLVPLVALSLSPEVHFECGSSLVVVRGCLLGTTTLVKSATATLKFEGSGGTQKDTDYTNDAGGTVSCKLESSVNGGAFAQSNQIQTATLSLSKELEVKD
jgi:hypothetical protein